MLLLLNFIQQLILQRKLGRDTLEEEEEEEKEEECDKGVGQGEESTHDTDQGLPSDEKTQSSSVGSTSETPVPASATSMSTATPATPISVFASPTKRELKGQSSVDSWNWELKRSSHRVKRSRKWSNASSSSRKWSNASSRSDSMTRVASELSRRESGGGVSTLVKKLSAMESDEEPVRWGLDQIELSDTDSELEFFDAKGEAVFVPT